MVAIQLILLTVLVGVRRVATVVFCHWNGRTRVKGEGNVKIRHIPPEGCRFPPQYGCRAADFYQIELILNPNGENIKYVSGGPMFSTQCLATKGADGFFRLNIPIEVVNDTMQTNCGVVNVPGTRDFTVSVRTRSLEDGYKGNDRMYNLQCHFNGPVQLTLVTPMGIALNTDVELIQVNNAPTIQSVLSFELVSAASNLPVGDVSFREPVYFRVRVDNNYHNSQSMRITACFADGVPSGRVNIIGADGCPDPDTAIVSEGFTMSPTDPTISVTPVFEMFMLPTASSIVFGCTVTLCPDTSCQQSCVPAGRRKREAETFKSGDIFALVRVGNGSDDKKSELPLRYDRELQQCTNWPYLVAIASLAFVLIISLGFGMLLFTRRSRECHVNNAKVKPMA